MSFKKSNPAVTLLPFLISILYWTYLAFSSKMDIVFDASSYETLGKLIVNDGWQTYFSTGPNREPFYPFLIASSMKLADFLHIPYYGIQTAIQILFHLTSQILLFIILKRLKTPTYLIAIITLYFGISPAMVNSTFSLFSEIITYPFVLLVVLTSVSSWKNILNNSKPIPYLLGLSLGGLFLLLTFIKATFEYSFYIFLIPFGLLMFNGLLTKNKNLFIKSFVFIGLSLTIFQTVMINYRNLNYHFNGQYTFTDRGPWLLYGNTQKRLQPLNKELLTSCFVFNLGDNLCYNHFSKESCDYWSQQHMEVLGYKKRQALQEELKILDVDQPLIQLSIKAVKEHPVNYIFITLVESIKIFFWESTRIGCVTYPAWLDKIFNMALFKNALRLIIGILTLTSFIYLLGHFVITFKSWLKRILISDDQSLTLFFSLTLFISFIFIYLAFYILTRYLFPIVPLYLIMIAFALSRISKRNKFS